MKAFNMVARGAIALGCLGLFGITFPGCSHDVERAKRDYVERGDRYVKAGDVDSAIIEYRNAVQEDPRFVDAYRKLSAAALSRGDGSAALRAALTAADLAPDLPDAQVEAGRLLLLAGRFADAKVRAANALARNSQHLPARLLLGNATAGLKDTDTAVKEFEEAIRLDPHQSSTYTSLAAVKATRGDREAAEQTFQQAITIAPKSTAARLALAQFYWSTDRPEDAERTMKDALAGKPGDQLANVSLAIFYQYTGRGDEAEPYLLAALASDPNARVTILVADYYLARNRVADALPLLQRLKLDKRFAVLASVRLAVIAQLQRQPGEAVRILDQALIAEPKNVVALAAKAELLRQQHQLDEALKVADAAVAADASFAEAEFIRGRILEAKKQFDQSEQAFNQVLRLNPRAAAAKLEIARMHLREGATDTVALASSATAADPRSLDAQLTLARALMRQHDEARAQSILEDVMRAAPRAAAVHAQLGTLLAMKNDLSGARKAFNAALERDAFQLEAIDGLTALDFKEQRRAEAIARLDGLIERKPNNAELLMIAARAYVAANQLAHAETLVAKALEADSELIAAYSMLGRIYLAEHRLDAARAQFEKIAAGQGRPLSALLVLGTIDQVQNRTADAEQEFKRALSLDPHSGVAANNLAWLYAENGGSLDLALQLALTAKAALPDHPEVNDTLGWIYYKKGMLDSAIAALQRSVELDPKNAAASYHLALAYEKSGNRDGARRMLEVYLTLDPASERSSEVKRRLEALARS